MIEQSIFAEKTDAAQAVAAEIAAESQRPRERPFHLALPGGSSPGLVFERLASMAADGAIDPARFRLFWIDDRCVGIDHPRSNAGLAKRGLGLLWDGAEICRIEGERRPNEAAALYEDTLARFGDAAAFDLALISVGPDGHVASLFPGDAGLAADGLVTPAKAPDGELRVSVTFEVLAACPRLPVLAWGREKAPPVKEALIAKPRGDSARSPFARAVCDREGVTFFMDAKCARTSGTAP